MGAGRGNIMIILMGKFIVNKSQKKDQKNFEKRKNIF